MSSLSTGTYTFESVGSQITENTITWNNKPSVDSVWARDEYLVGLGVKSITVDPSWIENNLSTGWVVIRGVRLINAATHFTFFSSDNGSSEPYLSINYGSDKYVKVGGNDASAGTSWATAWATVDKAATTATDGDVVHIGFGTYSSEPASNDIAPVNAGSLGIKYLPETATTGGGTGEVIVEVN